MKTPTTIKKATEEKMRLHSWRMPEVRSICMFPYFHELVTQLYWYISPFMQRRCKMTKWNTSMTWAGTTVEVTLITHDIKKGSEEKQCLVGSMHNYKWQGKQLFKTKNITKSKGMTKITSKISIKYRVFKAVRRNCMSDKRQTNSSPDWNSRNLKDKKR